MTWEKYYDKFYETDDDVVVRQISKINFGDPDEIEYEVTLPLEIAEIASYLETYNEKAALRLLKKAAKAGVKFTQEDLTELFFISDESLEEILYLSGESNYDFEPASVNSIHFDLKEHKQQLQKLVKATDDTLEHLFTVQKTLSESAFTSLWDIVSGGFFASVLKHTFLRKAEQEIKNAQLAVNNLNDELKELINNKVSSGTLLSVIDIWFDSKFADILVHFHINKIQKNINTAIDQITDIRKELIEQIENTNHLSI